MYEVALRAIDIKKSFGPIEVLHGVSIEVCKGSIHAVLGENGAGKSVLMKTLMGVHRADSGQIYVGDKKVSFHSPTEAQQQGISMVYQDFGLVLDLTVGENIFLGKMPTKGRHLIDWGKVDHNAQQVLAQLDVNIPSSILVSNLRIAERQEVEIARALSFNPRVFILDEPTSALSLEEIQHLHMLVKKLRDQGVGIIYISHKLDEVFNIADRVTILRDGKVQGNYYTKDLDISLIVEKMTGKKISVEIKRESNECVEPECNILEIRNFESKGLFSNINLAVGKGEIVGVAGVIGAGKTELAKAIFGALPAKSLNGVYRFDGGLVNYKKFSPQKATRMGIGFVTEDRANEGLIYDHTATFNISLPALWRVTKWGIVLFNKVAEIIKSVIERMMLRPPEPKRLVKQFSGGNAQKLVLCKWIAAQAKLLILDEPTQGVDVGAREEIYNSVKELSRSEGLGVLLFSSDLREVLQVSDRILVMRRGEIIAEHFPYELTEHNLLKLVAGK